MMLFRNNFIEKYNEATFSGEIIRKPTMEMWDELIDNDEYFNDELNKVSNNT